MLRPVPSLIQLNRVAFSNSNWSNRGLQSKPFRSTYVSSVKLLGQAFSVLGERRSRAVAEQENEGRQIEDSSERFDSL